jgi:hypothetical protein
LLAGGQVRLEHGEHGEHGMNGSVREVWIGGYHTILTGPNEFLSGGAVAGYSSVLALSVSKAEYERLAREYLVMRNLSARQMEYERTCRECEAEGPPTQEIYDFVYYLGTDGSVAVATVSA